MPGFVHIGGGMESDGLSNVLCLMLFAVWLMLQRYYVSNNDMLCNINNDVWASVRILYWANNYVSFETF